MAYDYKAPRSEWHRRAGAAIREARTSLGWRGYDLPVAPGTSSHLENGKVLDRRPYFEAAEALGITLADPAERCSSSSTPPPGRAADG